jgi:hypothetical protein
MDAGWRHWFLAKAGCGGSVKPSIGRIVHFRLSVDQAEQINRRRVSGGLAGIEVVPGGDIVWPAGAVRHVGNIVGPGSVVPMVVTAVWPEEYASNARLSHHPEGTTYDGPGGVNGQAILDGNDSLWVCSAPQHASLTGCWFWPQRES